MNVKADIQIPPGGALDMHESPNDQSKLTDPHIKSSKSPRELQMRDGYREQTAGEEVSEFGKVSKALSEVD